MKIKTLAAIAAATLLLSACGEKPTPESTAEAFSNHLYAGEFDKVIDMIDLGEIEKELGTDDKKAMSEIKGKLQKTVEQDAAKAKPEGGVKEVKASPAKCNDTKDKCSIKVTVAFKSGKTEEEKFNVKKAGDDWKISLI